MSDTIRTKCPYCGSSLLTEEDGYRCRFCKSFFPYDSEQEQEQTKPEPLSQIKQQVVEKKTPEEVKAEEEADKAFAKRRGIDELIGILTAFFSAALMLLSKVLKMPLLMIPGFVLWAFSAGYTAYRVYAAKKDGRKAAYLRIAVLLVIAILIVATVRID